MTHYEALEINALLRDANNLLLKARERIIEIQDKPNQNDLDLGWMVSNTTRLLIAEDLIRKVKSEYLGEFINEDLL